MNDFLCHFKFQVIQKSENQLIIQAPDVVRRKKHIYILIISFLGLSGLGFGGVYFILTPLNHLLIWWSKDIFWAFIRYFLFYVIYRQLRGNQQCG